MKKIAVLFGTCILLSGCSSDPKVNSQAEADTIRKMEEKWNIALQNRNAETIIDFYAKDAVLINAAKPTIVGLEGIRKFTESNLADTTMLYDTYSATIDDVEVSGSGDIAYTRGHDEITKKTGTGQVRTGGRWVDIWKKTDGQWKVVILATGDIPDVSAAGISVNQPLYDKNKVNQQEEMKRFLGDWKAEIGKDTVHFMSNKKFNNSYESYMKGVVKGKLWYEQKVLMGYNEDKGRIIVSVINNNSPSNTIYAGWFSSPGLFQEVFIDDMSNPSAARYMWNLEFKNDKMIWNTLENNKVVDKFVYTRVK